MFRLHQTFCKRRAFFLVPSSSGTTQQHIIFQHGINNIARKMVRQFLRIKHASISQWFFFCFLSSNAIDSLMRKYLKLFSQFHYTSIVQCTWHPEPRVGDRKRKTKKNKIEEKKEKKFEAITVYHQQSQCTRYECTNSKITAIKSALNDGDALQNQYPWKQYKLQSKQ